MYNKRKFNKINDKKVLHKVKKQWVTVSLALLMMIGGGAVVTHINVSADVTNNPSQQQTSVNIGSEKGNKNTITNKAKALHRNLLSRANVNKPINKQVHKQINTTHQGKLVTVNNKLAKKVNNINKVGMHKANLYHGYVYNRIDKPFQDLRINRTVALHPSVDLDEGHIFGYLHSGNVVKATRTFKQFGHYGDYLRYEISLADKHTAFITGESHAVSYVIPMRNYKYYQHKANKLVHKVNYKNAPKIRKQLHKLTKQRNHNFRKYANLYESAFNYQQRAKYPVIVNYNAKRHIKHMRTKHTAFITQTSNIPTSVSSAVSSSSASSASVSNSNVIPTVSSYVAPISLTSSATIQSSSMASKSNSASTNSISSSASYSSASSMKSSSASSINSKSSSASSMKSSSASSISSKSSSASSMRSSSANSISSKSSSASSSVSNSVSSASTSASSASKIPSSSNQPSIKSGIYNGLNYTYNPLTNGINFVNGKLNVTTRGSFLNNVDTPKDIRNAQSIIFGNVDLGDISDTNNMLANDVNVKYLTLGDNFNTQNVTNMGNMFRSDSSLQQINLGRSFNTSDVNNMRNMFCDDGDLTSLTLPMGFNTSNVNSDYSSDSDSMYHMFYGDSDLSSLTINSGNTKFNSNSDFNLENNQNLWTKQGSSITSDLGDGQSHVGTWIYTPHVNNVPANNTLPKYVNLSEISSNVENQISHEINGVLNTNNNSHLNLGLTNSSQQRPHLLLGATQSYSGTLTENSVYTELAQDVAKGASKSWNESDLTLTPDNITGPLDKKGTNVFNKAYADSDTLNKGLVRSTEENLGLIKVNGIGEAWHGSILSFNSDSVIANFIDGRTEVPGDPDYNGVHTIVKYSGPIHINNSSNDTIANELVNAFNITNTSKDKLKYAKDIGLGYKYYNGDLYGILVLGPEASGNPTMDNTIPGSLGSWTTPGTKAYNLAQYIFEDALKNKSNLYTAAGLVGNAESEGAMYGDPMQGENDSSGDNGQGIFQFTPPQSRYGWTVNGQVEEMLARMDSDGVTRKADTISDSATQICEEVEDPQDVSATLPTRISDAKLAYMIFEPIIQKQKSQCAQVKSDSKDVNLLTGLSYLPSDFVNNMIAKIKKSIPVQVCKSDSDNFDKLQGQEQEIEDAIKSSTVLQNGMKSIANILHAPLNKVTKVFSQASSDMGTDQGAPVESQWDSILNNNKYHLTSILSKIVANATAGGASGAAASMAGSAVLFAGTPKYLKHSKDIVDDMIQLFKDDFNIKTFITNKIKSQLIAEVNKIYSNYCKYCYREYLNSYGEIIEYTNSAPFLEDNANDASLIYINSKCGKFYVFSKTFINDIRDKSFKADMLSDLGEHDYYTIPPKN